MLISIGEILNQSYLLYKRHFKIFIEYVLLGLAAGMVMTLVQLVAIPIVLTSFFIAKYLGITLGIITLIIDLALFVAGLWINFAFIRTVSGATIGLTPEPIIETFKKTRPVLWRGFGASFLSGVFIILPLLIALAAYAITAFVMQNMGIVNFSPILRIAFVLLVIYSMVHIIIYSIRLCFSTIQAVIYDTPIMKSIKTSIALVRGRWWAIFGRLFVVGLIFVVGVSLLNGIITKIGTSVGGLIYILAVLITMVINILVGPFMLLALMTIFHSAEKNLTNMTPASKV